MHYHLIPNADINLYPLLCLPEQATSKPAQPEEKDTESRIAKPLVYLRGVGVQLWEKPKQNTTLTEDFVNTASQS